MYISNTSVSTDFISEIISQVNTLSIQEGELLFLMLAEKNAPDIAQLLEALNLLAIPFIGGIFPQLIYQAKKLDTGLILKKMPCWGEPLLIEKLSSGETNFEAIELPEQKAMTALVLVDGLTSNISPFLSKTYHCFGNQINYIGGGAGSLSLQQQPCLFNKDGFFEDAALLAFIPLETQLGVRHGWQKVFGPLIANKTDKNIIQELNWRNAFEVYKEVVEPDAGQAFQENNFFDIAKAYPFGLVREHSENVVRDPIMVNEKGALICVGEVPQNSVLDILKGDQQCLIEAAGKAVEDCKNENKSLQDLLIFDCISRVLFLEDDFNQELEAVQKGLPSNQLSQVSVPESEILTNVLLEGALTLGEISSHGQGHLEFFNKTIVIGFFYK